MTFPKNSSGACIRAWDLMPWVIQNSSTQEQNEWLKDHLANCESCSTEFAQQCRLQRAMLLPTDISVDANAGLRRLLGRLDMPDAQEAPLRSRSGNWFSRALVAVVLIQALSIGALGVKLWSASGSPPYRTLSQESLPVPPGAIRVVPDAAMTLASWNALLHALQLQVVGGPNDVGAYTVAPTNSISTTPHTLQQLRATRGIRLAEPVSVTP
jgi:hypothetical protein